MCVCVYSYAYVRYCAVLYINVQKSYLNFFCQFGVIGLWVDLVVLFSGFPFLVYEDFALIVCKGFCFLGSFVLFTFFVNGAK